MTEASCRRCQLDHPERNKRTRRKRRDADSSHQEWPSSKEDDLLAIKLMRTGAKKSPSYRVVVKEKQSKRDGAYLENLGTYNPTRNPAEIKLNLSRVNYWIEKGAQQLRTGTSGTPDKLFEPLGAVISLSWIQPKPFRSHRRR